MNDTRHGVRAALVVPIDIRARVARASERVREAARVVDRHRHGSCPTAEHELARAMSDYFDLAERAFGRDPQITTEDESP